MEIINTEEEKRRKASEESVECWRNLDTSRKKKFRPATKSLNPLLRGIQNKVDDEIAGGNSTLESLSINLVESGKRVSAKIKDIDGFWGVKFNIPMYILRTILPKCNIIRKKYCASIYIQIAMHINNDTNKEHLNGKCWISYEYIKAVTGISNNSTIADTLRTLEAIGLINIHKEGQGFKQYYSLTNNTINNLKDLKEFNNSVDAKLMELCPPKRLVDVNKRITELNKYNDTGVRKRKLLDLFEFPDVSILRNWMFQAELIKKNSSLFFLSFLSKSTFTFIKYNYVKLNICDYTIGYIARELGLEKKQAKAIMDAYVDCEYFLNQPNTDKRSKKDVTRNNKITADEYIINKDIKKDANLIRNPEMIAKALDEHNIIPNIDLSGEDIQYRTEIKDKVDRIVGADTINVILCPVCSHIYKNIEDFTNHIEDKNDSKHKELRKVVMLNENITSFLTYAKQALIDSYYYNHRKEIEDVQKKIERSEKAKARPKRKKKVSKAKRRAYEKKYREKRKLKKQLELQQLQEKLQNSKNTAANKNEIVEKELNAKNTTKTNNTNTNKNLNKNKTIKNNIQVSMNTKNNDNTITNCIITNNFYNLYNNNQIINATLTKNTLNTNNIYNQYTKNRYTNNTNNTNNTNERITNNININNKKTNGQEKQNTNKHIPQIKKIQLFNKTINKIPITKIPFNLNTKIQKTPSKISIKQEIHDIQNNLIQINPDS